MDGEPDCFDNSDECPGNQKDIYSSNYHLLGNVIYRTALWIMASLALLGNGVSVKFVTKESQDCKNKANYMLNCVVFKTIIYYNRSYWINLMRGNIPSLWLILF